MTTHLKPTLGVVAICKDEEGDLPGLLENLLPWVDEVVLVDDGSTDDTVAIAEHWDGSEVRGQKSEVSQTGDVTEDGGRRTEVGQSREGPGDGKQASVIARAAGKTVKVVEHRRDEETGFAGLRNAGLAAATSDWILNMDVDERVSGALAEEMAAAILDTHFNAFRYRRLNFFLHRRMKGKGWTSWNNPQLARKGKHHYEGKVHERCVVEGETGQLKNMMWHLNDESYAERMRKSFQYCQLEAEARLASGFSASAFGILLRPVAVFFKEYFAKCGFRDGAPGLIAAMHSACAEFRTLALIWDEQNRLPRPGAGGRRSEDGGRKTEDGGRKTEDGGRGD